MRRGVQYLLFFAVTAFLAVFLLLPVWTVIETGSRPGLIAEIFRNRIYTEGLINSFAVAVVTTSGVFVISLALALIYDRFDFPGKEMCNVLMLVPMILPPFVGALGFSSFSATTVCSTHCWTRWDLPAWTFSEAAASSGRYA